MLFAGCGYGSGWLRNGLKVGPNYGRPAAPVAASYIEADDMRVVTDPAEHPYWWANFRDPVLDSLVLEAFQQNLTLREAGARILQARAQRAIAAGNVFPQLQQGFGDYSRNAASANSALPTPKLFFSDIQTGFNLSWEIDFFGRFRRAVEAADADLDASIENYDDVLVILLSDVASAYIEIRAFEERIQYAQSNVTIQRTSFDISDTRFKAGAVSELDVTQARDLLATTQASIPSLENSRLQAHYQLCVLLGIPAQDLTARLGGRGPIPFTPTNVVVGIPAELIRRRPDVRRAERQVAAQSAQIGVAVSDFYPRISFGGTIGANAEDFDNLFRSSSFIGSAVPQFNWAILNYGRILNNVRANDAAYQALVYAYQDSLLQAGQQVQGGITGFLRAQEVAARLAEAVDAAKKSTDISVAQYRNGAADYTRVLNAQQSLVGGQDSVVQARAAIALNLISVYRALGGGWQIRLSGSGPAFVEPPLAPPPAVEQDDPFPPPPHVDDAADDGDAAANPRPVGPLVQGPLRLGAASSPVLQTLR